MPPPNLPPGQTGDFKLKTIKKQQTQEKLCPPPFLLKAERDSAFAKVPSFLSCILRRRLALQSPELAFSAGGRASESA